MKKANPQLRRGRKHWELLLWALIVLTVAGMFFVFSKQNQERILRQNENYVQDHAVQKAKHLDQVLSESATNIEILAYWFGQTLESDQVTPAQLQQLQDNSAFDYVRFADAAGTNYSADGRTNDARDRDYYLEGMQGHTGISVTMQSRITSETLVNFYTPLRRNGKIIGVLRGVYLADVRMKDILESSFFGVEATSFLCMADGTLIAGSGGTSQIPSSSLLDTLPNYLSEEVADSVRQALVSGEPAAFTYQMEYGLGNGYIIKLESQDWYLVQTFPAAVTAQMYHDAVHAGVILEIALIVLFLAYIVYMVIANQRQKKRLLAENRDMSYVIHGVPQLFDRFILADLEQGTYRYLMDGEPAYGLIGKTGEYRDLAAYILENVDGERDRQRMMNFLMPNTLRSKLEQGEFEVSVEHRSRRSNGVWVRLSAVCVERKAGVPVKVLLATQDITDAKREEQARQETLQNAMQAAERANNAKSTFLFNMSHDIRTPMNAIIGFADLAEQSIDDPETARNYISKIKSSGDILLNIINDILDLARIESGKTALHPAPADLRRLMDNMRDMFAEGMTAAGIDFRLELEAADPCVVCDQIRVNQILINLLSNAQKFTPRGGQVRCRMEQSGAAREGMADYRLTIQDTGIGISPEFLPRIFGAFERERSATVAGIHGTGLGLSIVKDLVEMMNGEISVESTQGQGTCFTVRLRFPVAAPETVEAGSRVQPAADFSGKRVLLVEDNELNREIALEILRHNGIQVDTAEDGRIAVDRVIQAPPGTYDLILMDIQMPNMDGYEATRAIRALEDPARAEIPIVAMTANAFEEDRKNALDCGMNDHISKPIDVPTLMACLARLLA